MMRLKFSLQGLVIASALLASAHAHACSCPRFDAKEFVENFDYIFVAEVTAVWPQDSALADFYGGSHLSVPFSYQAIEVLKGSVAPIGRLLAVGPSSSCHQIFEPGHRYVLMLSVGQLVVGNCNLPTNPQQQLPALRAAAKLVQ